MISRHSSEIAQMMPVGTLPSHSSVLGNPRFPAVHVPPQAASSSAPLQNTALSEESPAHKIDFGHSAVQHFSHTASQNSFHLPEERTCIIGTAETRAPRGGFQGHRTEQARLDKKDGKTDKVQNPSKTGTDVTEGKNMKISCSNNQAVYGEKLEVSTRKVEGGGKRDEQKTGNSFHQGNVLWKWALRKEKLGWHIQSIPTA